MLATFFAVALLVSPASVPNRWLLKLTPAELPKLSDTFWKTTWFDSFNPRSLRGAWTEWTAFAPGTGTKGPEVTVIHKSGRFDDQTITGRVSPLAAHGPLVEFDRRLYTVALTERQNVEGKTIKYLNLGAAIEFKPNAWYQAYSETFTDGKVRVTERLVEFASDPRKEKGGKAKVQIFVRMLTERKGELTEYDGEFTAIKGRYGSAVRVTGKVGNGVGHIRLELPYEEVPAHFDTAPFRQLSAANGDAPALPKPAPPPELVQPPGK